MARQFKALVLMLGLLLALTVATAGPVAAQTQYICPASTCSFSVPDYYSKVTSDETSIVFKDANSGGAFTVTAVDFPATGTLDEATDAVIAQFSGKPGYQADPAGVQQETLSGNPARSFVFGSINESGTNVLTKIFLSVYQGKIYVLSFSTTPEAADAFVTGAKPVFDSWLFT